LQSGEIRRAAVIHDAFSNSSLRIELGQPVIKLSSGESIIIPFKEFDYTAKLDLSLLNVFDYLRTEAFDMPDKAETICFKLEVKSFPQDTLSVGFLNENKITSFQHVELNILAKDGTVQSILTYLGNQSLSEKSGIHNFSKAFEMSAKALKNKSLFLIPKVDVKGSLNEKGLQFSLVNISIEGSSELPKNLFAENSAPKEYLLEQNYPNPFNPSTQIKFSIPQNEFVILKVYDIIGREIAELVNEQKPAGTYSVSFDASNLASGIYLYSINAGTFKQINKMILLR
jgi:hypothetical protein